jgi:hypothetical protein
MGDYEEGIRLRTLAAQQEAAMIGAIHVIKDRIAQWENRRPDTVGEIREAP